MRIGSEIIKGVVYNKDLVFWWSVFPCVTSPHCLLDLPWHVCPSMHLFLFVFSLKYIKCNRCGEMVLSVGVIQCFSILLQETPSSTARFRCLDLWPRPKLHTLELVLLLNKYMLCIVTNVESVNAMAIQKCFKLISGASTQYLPNTFSFVANSLVLNQIVRFPADTHT